MKRRPGPPPTPSTLRLLQGNPGRRALNPREPTPVSVTTTDPPAYLTPAAAVIWRELAPHLHALQLLTVVYVRALATGCRLQALGERFLSAEEARLADTSRTKTGRKRKTYTRPSPATWAGQKLVEKAHGFFARFGIMPAERTRLHASPATPEDPIAAFRRARPVTPRARA